MRAFKLRHCNNTAICSSRIKSEVTINGRIKELHIVMRSLLHLVRLSQIASSELRTKCYWLTLCFSHALGTSDSQIRYFLARWRKQYVLSFQASHSTLAAFLSEPWLCTSRLCAPEQVTTCLSHLLFPLK